MIRTFTDYAAWRKAIDDIGLPYDYLTGPSAVGPRYDPEFTRAYNRSAIVHQFSHRDGLGTVSLKTTEPPEIGRYVRQGASRAAIQTGLDIVGPYMGKARKRAVNEPVSGLLEAAALTLASPLEELALAGLLAGGKPVQAEVGRFVRPPQVLSKMGGKWRNSEVLNQVLTEITDGFPYVWLDVCGGTGIVTFMALMGDAADGCERAYFNDKDPQTANFFRVLKDNPQGLMASAKRIGEAMSGMDSRDAFDHAVKFSGSTNLITRAAAYMIKQKTSFGGKGRNPALAVTGAQRDRQSERRANLWTNVPRWAAVFADVTIWNKDATHAIRDFTQAESKHPQRIVFYDPPYLGHGASDEYDITMSPAEHKQVAQLIAQRANTYIVTHTINDEFREIYGKGDYEVHYPVRFTMNNEDGGQVVTETVSVWYQR